MVCFQKDGYIRLPMNFYFVYLRWKNHLLYKFKIQVTASDYQASADIDGSEKIVMEDRRTRVASCSHSKGRNVYISYNKFQPFRNQHVHHLDIIGGYDSQEKNTVGIFTQEVEGKRPLYIERRIALLSVQKGGSTAYASSSG